MTNELMKRAAEVAETYGLKVGESAVEQTKRFRVELNLAGIILDSVKIKIGNALLPEVVKLSGELTRLIPVANAIIFVMKGVIIAVEEVTLVFRSLYSFISAASGNMISVLSASWEAIGMIVSGNFSGAIDLVEKAIDRAGLKMKLANAIAEADAAKTHAFLAALWAETPGPTSGITKGGGKAFVEPPKKTETSRVSEWELELKEMMMAQKKFDGLSIEEERSFWEAKLAITKKGTEEERSVKTKLYEVAKRAYEEQKKIAEAAAKAEQKALEEDSKAMGDFAQATIDANDKLAQLDATAAKAFQDIKEAAHIKIEIDLAEMRNEAVEAAIKGTIDAAISDVKRLEEEAAKIKKVWQNIGDAIGNAFSTSIRGVIQGTLTLKKALQNIFQSILLSFIDMVVKMVQQWIFGEMAKLGISKMISSVLIALGITTAAAETGTQAAASVATTGIKVEEATTVVTANAVEAASGAAAAESSIPYIGPILAAAAFAAMLALVLGGLGMIKSAAGGWDVDQGSLAMIHKNEMVLPASLAEGVRGMIGGGGSGRAGRPNVHINVKSLDGMDAFRVFNKHSRKIAKSLESYSRNRYGVRR